MKKYLILTLGLIFMPTFIVFAQEPAPGETAWCIKVELPIVDEIDRCFSGQGECAGVEIACGVLPGCDVNDSCEEEVVPDPGGNWCYEFTVPVLGEYFECDANQERCQAKRVACEQAPDSLCEVRSECEYHEPEGGDTDPDPNPDGGGTTPPNPDDDPTTTGGNGEGSVTATLNNPLQSNNLIDLINTLLIGLTNILIPLAVLAIIFAGFQYVLAQGKPESIKKAHQSLKYVLIGTAIILGARVIMEIVKVTIESL